MHEINAAQKEAKTDSDSEEEQSQFKDEKFSNHRLLTPRLRQLMANKDARVMLHEEVQESALRLKKAKFGHKLSEIVPDHQRQFYLPDKSRYLPKERQNLPYNASKSSLGKLSKSQAHKTRGGLFAGSNLSQLEASPHLSRGQAREKQQQANAASLFVDDPSFMTEPAGVHFPYTAQKNT